MLFDEPCSALDPISTAKIEELIDELKQDYTIVIVTHNMQQAARVSDFTAFMYLGELIEFGATETIFTTPRGQAHPGLHHRPLRLTGHGRQKTTHGANTPLKCFDEELERLNADDQRDGRPGREPARAARSMALRERDTEVGRAGDRRRRPRRCPRRAVQEQTVQAAGAAPADGGRPARVILSSIKIAAALERIADYAKNIAKRTIVLTQVTAPAVGR